MSNLLHRINGMFTKIVVIVVFFLVISWIVDRIMRKRMTADLIKVPTKLTSYYVKNLPNQREAAELLDTTRKKLFDVINHLKEIDENEIPPGLVSGIKRMVAKHCHHIELTELEADKFGQVAMNMNKGKSIYLCLRSCPDCLDLTHESRLFIVALHELAHSCTENYDPLVNGTTQHGEEFRLYEGYLIFIAESLNLLDANSVVGSDYCGVRLPPVKALKP